MCRSQGGEDLTRGVFSYSFTEIHVLTLHRLERGCQKCKSVQGLGSRVHCETGRLLSLCPFHETGHGGQDVRQDGLTHTTCPTWTLHKIHRPYVALT